MVFKIIIVLFLVAILFCLASALFYLIRQGQGSVGLAKALTWRIVLSLCLFCLILVAYMVGWISPHEIMVVPTQ